jgi:hypothetical protein
MGDRIGTAIPGGLLIPSQLTHDKLRPVVTPPTPADSSYTQSTSRPGHGKPLDALSKLTAHVHNSQDEDVLVRSIKAGMPGRNGAQLAYRLASEVGDTQYRGWNPPIYANGQAFPEYGSTGFGRFDAATIPSTQEILCFRTESPPSPLVSGGSRVINPSTRSYSALGATLPVAANWSYPALLVLPESERALLQFGNSMYYSDDKGATWATYSEDPYLGNASTFGRSRMAYFRGDVGMLVQDTAAGDIVHQLASSDLGATFDLVGTTPALGHSVALVQSVDGLFVFYIRQSDDFPVIRRLSSPFEDLTNTEETAITSAAYLEGSLTADPDGTLYAHLRLASGVIEAWGSVDAGVSWVRYGTAHTMGTTADRLDVGATVPCLGSVVMLGPWASSVSITVGLSALWLGGWQAVTSDGATSPSARTAFTENWTPIELPQNAGATWVETGAASTLVSPGELERVTVASTSFHTRTVPGLSPDVEQLVLCQVRVDSGGDLATRVCHVGGRMADGASDYRWSVNFSTAGFRVYDIVTPAQIGTDRLFDLTSDAIILIWANRGTISTYWWRPGQSRVNVGPSGSLVNNAGAPAATGFLRWGHGVAGTCTSHWAQFQWARQQLAVSTLNIYEPQNGPLLIRGKPITRYPVPVPDIGSVGFLSATSGPARRDDGYTIPAAYDYPMSNAFCRLSPSPDVRWRSSGLTEQILTFKFPEDVWVGDSLGLFVSGANFRTAYLESSPDGVTWTTRGTLNLSEGFEGLAGIRSGSALIPDVSASPPADRYLFEGSLVGGHAQLGGVPPALRKVTAQTAGGWTPATTAKPVLTLEGVASTDPTSPAGMNLVFPSGLLVVHLAAQLFVDWWRVRIPVQDCPDDYFEAGVLMAGKLAAFGDRIDWGRGDEMVGNAAVTVDSYGTSRARQLGPPARRWSIHWQSGTNHCEIRSGPDVDYVGPTTGIPMVGDEDVLYRLFGHLQEMESGQVPCVAIEEIPDADTTLTDSTRFIYGRLTSSARGNGTAGDLGVNEQQRIEALVFDEIK